jgi:hypothetical protein
MSKKKPRRILYDFDEDENTDDDETVQFNAIQKPPGSNSLCNCLYVVFGINSNERAIHEAQLALNHLISQKKKQYNTLEFSLNKYNYQLSECRRKNDIKNGLRLFKLIINTKKRMDRVLLHLSSSEAQLCQLEDLEQGKSVVQSMKVIDKSFKKLNIGKTLSLADKTLESIENNSADISELNELLTSTYNVSNSMNEEDMIKDFKKLWNEISEEEEEEEDEADAGLVDEDLNNNNPDNDAAMSETVSLPSIKAKKTTKIDYAKKMIA